MKNSNDCERAAGLLSATWEGQAEPQYTDRQWLEEHLTGCTDCAAMAALWQRLGELPQAMPAEHQRRRFEQMLAGYQQGMQATSVGQAKPARPVRAGGWARLAWHPLPALAAAVLLIAGLAAGVAGGYLLRGSPAAAGVSPAASTAQQIAELREEVQSTRQLAVLSLLRQSSPNDRLQGVSYSAGMVPSDPEIVDALLHSLKYDGNPDVRLAALDALTRHAALPDIQRGLVTAFAYQKSPLLQVALVDSYVASRDPQARGLLKTVSESTTYQKAVRQRAAWGLKAVDSEQ